MPSKRHEELKSFGHRILTYMSADDIRNEEIVNVKLADGTDKRYRIDVVGYWTKYNSILKEVYIEIGNNNFDKINNLRLAGYNVMVIPYSEKEEEWQDEKKLMQIMIDANEDMVRRFCKLTSIWNKIAEDKLEEINNYEDKLNNIKTNILTIENKGNILYALLRRITEIKVQWSEKGQKEYDKMFGEHNI